MWFFNICCKVSCLIKMTKRSGVLSSEFNSSTRMNGSSSKCSLIFISYKMLKPDDSILFKNWPIRCFKAKVFYLCCNQTYSVIELRFGVTISSPSSFNNIISTFFNCGAKVLFSIDSYTLSHWIISINACISKETFWKKGLRSWIIL